MKASFARTAQATSFVAATLVSITAAACGGSSTESASEPGPPTAAKARRGLGDHDPTGPKSA